MENMAGEAVTLSPTKIYWIHFAPASQDLHLLDDREMVVRCDFVSAADQRTERFMCAELGLEVVENRNNLLLSITIRNME
jgi:hypothetical protein